MRSTKKQNKKGSAIAYALVLVSIISIIFFSVVQFVSNQSKSALENQSSQQAFQIAEAGINFYRWYLAHETDGKSSIQIRDFWQSTSPAPIGLGESEYEEEYKDSQGGPIGKYSIKAERPVPGSTIVNVTVTGWTYKYPKIQRKIKVRFRRPSWSEYTILTNEFTNFGDGWTVKGKIMSNTGVHFDGVAYNTVYAGLNEYYDSDVNANRPGVWSSWQDEYNTNENSQVFLGGKQYPFAQKDFNGITVDLDMMKTISMSPSGGTVNGCTAEACHFSSVGQGRHIILKADGTFDLKTVTAVKNGSSAGAIKTESFVGNYNIPNNGVIFIDSDVWVEGTVNGRRVTIIAANLPVSGVDANIYLGLNDIKYTSFNGEDIIGLIAQGNVETIHAGKDSLIIDAALLAQNGMVGSQEHNFKCCSAQCAGLKSLVNFYGSIASNKRLAIMYDRKDCNNESNLGGYLHKGIQFDNNLLYFPPPYFPTGTEYAIDLWDEVTH
jgi:hypothetical protein